MTVRDDELGDLVERARHLEKRSVARLIEVFEDTRPSAASRRAAVLDALERDGAGAGAARAGGACTIGITGTPGSGKSTLVSEVVPRLLAARDDLSVGVLAVDPSSHVSRGSLLGDRTRVRFPPDEVRCFFRSQATATALGGLAPTTYQLSRLFAHLFDVVLVETVGIGQSELDIRHLADYVFLVIQPLGGDEIQYLKAGIIEIPDAFILNKSDDPAARMTYRQLHSSLSLARPFETEYPPIHRTSATTGDGLDDLVAALLGVIEGGPRTTERRRQAHFFRRWVDDEWGRTGLRFLADEPEGAAGLIDAAGGFDEAQRTFGTTITRRLAEDLPPD